MGADSKIQWTHHNETAMTGENDSHRRTARTMSDTNKQDGSSVFMPLPSIHWHHTDNDGNEVPDDEKCWWISFDVGSDYIDMQLYPDGTFEWFATKRGQLDYEGNDREPFDAVAACPKFAARMEAIKVGLLAAAQSKPVTAGTSTDAVALRAMAERLKALRDLPHAERVKWLQDNGLMP